MGVYDFAIKCYCELIKYNLIDLVLIERRKCMKRKFVIPVISYVRLVPEEVVARLCWQCTANGSFNC